MSSGRVTKLRQNWGLRARVGFPTHNRHASGTARRNLWFVHRNFASSMTGCPDKLQQEADAGNAVHPAASRAAPDPPLTDARQFDILRSSSTRLGAHELHRLGEAQRQFASLGLRAATRGHLTARSNFGYSIHAARERAQRNIRCLMALKLTMTCGPYDRARAHRRQHQTRRHRSRHYCQ